MIKECNKCCFTYEGLKYYPMKPTLDVINLNDIAHALSLCCRFGGHIRQHYSVAQHLIECMKYVKYSFDVGSFDGHGREKQYRDDCFINQFDLDRWDAKAKHKLMLHALMHDASEAYLTDLPKPIKVLIPKYQEMETLWEAKITEKFELPKLTEEEHRFIKSVDCLMLRCECASLWKVNQDEFLYDYPEVDVHWQRYIDAVGNIVPELNTWKIEQQFQTEYYKLQYKLKLS